MTRNAIDMSSYLKTSLSAGKDEKDGIRVLFDGKEVLVNSAEYGYENFTNMMVKTLRETGTQPKDCLLVFEGLQSKSKRLIWDSTYKAKRDKKPPEFYEQFQRLREYVEKQWLDLGAISLCQDYAEGDDTLAFLAKHSEEDLVISSRDSDLGVFNFVNEYGANIETYNDGLRGVPKIDGEPFVHPPKYITLYKALVGDSSDSIPGCKGFGAAAFQKLAEQYEYDGLDELMGLLDAGNLGPLHDMAEDKEHKLLKKVIEQEADVIRAWKLVKMYPEWVNTMKNPLRIQGGKVSTLTPEADERLKDFYGQEWLVTAENFEESLAFFKANAKGPEVTFDIETSTPPESDEWIEAMPKKKGKGGDKVDQLGSVLTGFSFTFGLNNEFTMYVSVDHYATDNVPMSKARELIEAAIEAKKDIVIQNNFFELSVLAMQKDETGLSWLERWAHVWPEWHGFIPRTLDTKLEASYVNENISTGLKFRSKHHLGYEQQTFQQTTQLTWPREEMNRMYPGGRVIASDDDSITVQYKMRELPAEHVVGYGCDDTICTAALHNLFKFVMQMEHTYKVYLETEIDASYQHVKNFIDGMPFSLEKMRELERHDDAAFNKAWETVSAYLIKMGWEGTVPPTYAPDITCKQIKEAYQIVVLGAGMGGAPEIELDGDSDDEENEAAEPAESEEEEGSKDPILSSKVRTPSKLLAAIRELGHEVFAAKLERCMSGEAEQFTAWVRESFSGMPLFKASNKQMCHLLYEVMGLPIEVRGKATKIMRSKGITEGNPKGDNLALEYALRRADDAQKAVIESIKLMRMVLTRRQLYYSKYPWAMHWKTGRIHASHNQCQTNTRRASESDPNKQQLPKHPKIEGQPARFRECLVPHHENAVIVSMDFSAQELRVIADYSQDPNMVACYVGDNKKDMHSFIAIGIVQKRYKDKATWTYEQFMTYLKDPEHPEHKFCKEMRALGKKVGFTTEYGAMAEKLAMTMLVTVEEAQVFIDAKEKAFGVSASWKQSVIAEAKRTGLVSTKLGALRHLRDAFLSEDHWVRSKAERQAVNFKIQSSSAEMTKRAEGRMWKDAIFFDFDAVCLGPVHDEVLASVSVTDLIPFLKRMHACMVAPYADMQIPILSEISFGPNFGTQIEVGAEPDEAAIRKGLQQLVEIEPHYAKIIESI